MAAAGDAPSGLEAALLGLVQGLTEFLPVSSSGHLVIAEALLGAHSEGLLFEIAVHVGTLGAILVFYRLRIAALLRGVARAEGEAWRYGAKLALGTLPAAAVGLGLERWVEAAFDRPWVPGVALLATGALLYTTRRTAATATGGEPGWGPALLIGCAQAIAIVPGISRSGATVAVALALGVGPLAATEFSFLLAVAAIGGAALLALPEARAADPDALAALAVGATVALASGLAALALFVRLLRRRRFHHFAWYTWAVGGAFLAWLALGG